METRRFYPLYAPSAGSAPGQLLPSTTIAATVAAAANTIPFAGVVSGNSMVQIQISNQTTAWAFVNFGVVGSIVAATQAAGYPVAPGVSVIVSVAAEVNGASVILATGGTAGNVTFTRGEGI
jgi:hypothetical protein